MTRRRNDLPQSPNGGVLADTLMALAKAGVQIRFDSSESRVVGDGWPRDAEATRDEVCRELEATLREIRVLDGRLKKLAEKLPDPAEYQLDAEGLSPDDIPPSVYMELHGAVIHFLDEVSSDAERIVEHALCATPESLREEWIARKFPHRVGEALRTVLGAPAAPSRPDPPSDSEIAVARHGHR